jgi:hypothetical protein
MDQLTPNEVQDRKKELAWWKAKPTHQVLLKTNNVGSIDHWEIQGGGGEEHHT